jgi:hypothetical protein
LLAAGAVAAPTPEREVIDRYCLGCHNTKVKTGGLALDTDQPPETWEKVVRKLRVRHMPPAGLPRPDERTYDSVVSALEAKLDSAAAANPNPGRTDTFRRSTAPSIRTPSAIFSPWTSTSPRSFPVMNPATVLTM